jgi:hypothetical protein
MRMTRIIPDKARKISVNPLYPRHPRSIIPYADLIIALSAREIPPPATDD